LGASAIHNWTLLKENKQTTLTVEESLQGFLSHALQEIFSKKFRRRHEKEFGRTQVCR